MNINNLITNEPSKLRALTSLLPEEFMYLLPKFEAKWLTYIEKYTLEGKPRFNKYSPRKDKKLALIEEKLLFILIFNKQNPTQEFLAFSFDLDQDMCNKWIKVLLPILEKSLHEFQAEQKPSKINTVLKENETYCVDVTERPLQRDTYEQELFYSGKKKQHTVKNLIITDKDGLVAFYSPTYGGPVHDKKIADSLEISTKCTLMTDLGFYGWNIPNVNIQMPHKKPKGKELRKIEKIENKQFSSIRVKIENTLGNIKILRIVKETIRTYIQEVKHQVFGIAISLYNLRKTFSNKRKIIYL